MALTPAQIDAYASQMFQMVLTMERDGVLVGRELRRLPAPVRDFGILHDYFDPNVGWSQEIDNLDIDDWVTVSNRLHNMLAAR